MKKRELRERVEMLERELRVAMETVRLVEDQNERLRQRILSAAWDGADAPSCPSLWRKPPETTTTCYAEAGPYDGGNP